MKQTAVQWLIDHFKKLQSDGEKMSWDQIIQIVELAKKEERQQIEDALLYGHAEATHTSPVIDLSFTDRYFTENFEQ
jgi:hypothetical protein